MLRLESGRHAAIRDLDAIISRLHGLDTEDWNRPTPNEGWAIRDLAAHLSTSVRALTERLASIVTDRTGKPIELDDAVDVVPVTSEETPVRLIASLTHHRNVLRHVLIALNDEDMETSVESASVPSYPSDGRAQLTACVFEFGFHRYDLDASLDERDAGLPSETIIATDDLYASRMVEIATRDGKKPSAPIAYHFAGALIDRWLTWNGSEWTSTIGDTTNAVSIQGDESAIALFLCGRIAVPQANVVFERWSCFTGRDLLRTPKAATSLPCSPPCRNLHPITPDAGSGQSPPAWDLPPRPGPFSHTSITSDPRRSGFAIGLHVLHAGSIRV